MITLVLEPEDYEIILMALREADIDYPSSMYKDVLKSISLEEDRGKGFN